MNNSTIIRTGKHVVYDLHAHLVFVTKYHRAVFTNAMLSRMSEIFHNVCVDFECELVEFDGENDHVHLMVRYPPKVTLSKLINSLKGVSSRYLRRDFKEQTERYYWKGILWSPSYFVSSCGGAPISIIRQYIQNQSTPS